MNRVVRIFGISVVALLITTGTARAVPIIGFGSPLSDPVLAGGSQEGFDAVATQIVPSITLGNVTYTGIGSPLSIGPDFNGSFNTTGGKSLFNDSDLIPDAFRFDFATTVSAFGFNWGAADNNWLLGAFDIGGVLIESFLLPETFASNAGEFFGIAAAGISFAIITDQKNNFASGDFVFIDRFTDVVAVPEPGTLALLGLGLVGMGLGRRKKKL